MILGICPEETIIQKNTSPRPSLSLLHQQCVPARLYMRSWTPHTSPVPSEWGLVTDLTTPWTIPWASWGNPSASWMAPSCTSGRPNSWQGAQSGGVWLPPRPERMGGGRECLTLCQWCCCPGLPETLWAVAWGLSPKCPVMIRYGLNILKLVDHKCVMAYNNHLSSAWERIQQCELSLQQFGGGPERTLLWFVLGSVVPVISSGGFAISDLASGPLVPFGFIFVCGVMGCAFACSSPVF